MYKTRNVCLADSHVSDTVALSGTDATVIYGTCPLSSLSHKYVPIGDRHIFMGFREETLGPCGPEIYYFYLNP